MRNRARLALVLLASACGWEAEPTGSTDNLRDETAIKPSATPDLPAPVISDGRTTGHPSFYFLWPIVQQQVPRDHPFDRDAQPTVTICRIVAGSCITTIAEFPFAAGGGVGLRTTREFAAFEFYLATWVSPRNGSGQYRATVRARGSAVGFADIQVVRRLWDLLTVPNHVVGVIEGWPLPIPFRLERGNDPGTIGPAGGTVELAGGTVRLDVPAGALATTTTLTATAATGLPPGPPIIPGTAWDFGPDGLTFAGPVTMQIRYDPARLPAGVVEQDLRIHKVVDGQYLQQPAGAVDPVTRTVSARVDGFSVYVIVPRVPGREVDSTPPRLAGPVEVFDPVSGTWRSTATIDVNSARATIRMRVRLEDDISGVRTVVIALVSPSGTRTQSCSITGGPVIGSDTDGTWECTGSFPRYGEPGTWRIRQILVVDQVQNGGGYRPQTGSGLLCQVRPNTNPPELFDCESASLPTLEVVAEPWDDTAPVVNGPVEVSLDTEPRNFAQTVAIAVGAGPRTIVARVPFVEDLSGIDLAVIQLARVGGGGSVSSLCGPTGPGVLECRVTVQPTAASGTYRLASLELADAASNFRRYHEQPDGRLCTQDGASCLATRPSIDVTGSTDTQAPELQSLMIDANGADVTTTVELTDDETGIRDVMIWYVSTTTTQFQVCVAPPTGGPLAATLSCTITFPAAAARGQWIIRIQTTDAAGNARTYERRASDGFLCYPNLPGPPVCQNFGSTDLILP